MGAEHLGDPGPGDYDAGVPVPEGEHAQAADFQEERGGVAPRASAADYGRCATCLAAADAEQAERETTG
jgi:hypothetical protein